MKKYISFIVLSGVVVFTVFLYIDNHRQPAAETVDEIIDKEELYAFGKDLNDVLSGTQMPDINCIDISGDSIKLSDLVTGERVLALYYSEMHCSSCYEKQFDLLQHLPLDSTKLLVIGAHSSHRSFKFYWSRSSYSLPAYYIDYISLDWYANKYFFPYFFILDKDLTVSYFHVPDQKDVEKNKRYVLGVKNNFF